MNRIEAMRAAVLAGLLAGAEFCLPSSPSRAADEPKAGGADAGAVAAAAPATAPARKPAVVTFHDVRQGRLAFNRRTLSGAYKAVGRHDPAWDEQAVAFLDKMADYFTAGTVPEFYRPTEFYSNKQGLADGATLVAGGCDDPLVLYCYGAVLMDSGNDDEALPVLRQAGAGLRRAGYPPNRVASVSERLAQLSKDKTESAALEARARADYVNACCGPQAAADRKPLIDIVWSWMEERPAQQAFVAALAARPDADPWLLGVASGRLHVKLAWDSRGNGSARDVTEEGWKGYLANMKLARDDLVGAWKVDPTLPEAPTEMITVCTGAGPELGEQAEEWFGRALAAQVDDERPYQLMLYGPLQARWGGSREAMMQLGDACLVNPRYDTMVPWKYVYAVKSVGVDSGRPWALLNDPAVYDKVAAVCDGYLKAVPSGRQDAFWRSAKAAAAWKAERWSDARKALDEQSAGGGKPVPATFRWFGADDGLTAAAEVYARTGPRADDLTAAEELAAVGKPAEAIAKFRAAADALGAADPASRYLAVQAGRLDAGLKFAAGDWASLDVGGLAGWRQNEGIWRATDDGALAGQPGKTGWSRLVWSDPASRQLGTAFEISGTVRFPVTGKRRLPSYSGGVFLFNREGESTTLFVGLWKPGNSVGFNAHGSPDKSYPRKMSDAPTFRVRVVGRDVTLWVDGKPVGEPYKLPDGLRPELGFAVGGYGKAAATVTFADLKVRKLPEGEGAGKP